MTDKTTHPMDDAKISEQNMQFHIIHCHPECSAKENQDRKAKIEKELYTVFEKHGEIKDV